MSFQHLSLEERHYIEIAFKEGLSQNTIAKHLLRCQSTISRELQRNRGKKGYRHKQAHRITQKRHVAKPKACKMTRELKVKIAHYLHQKWSPEQIAGRLKKSGEADIHYETIYQYILEDKRCGGVLFLNLRHQNKKYRKRYGSAHNRTGIPNRVDIAKRPLEANERMRVGDWEFDTIVGKRHKGAIVTMDDRKSKLRLAMPVQKRSAQLVTQAIVTLLTPIKEFVKTGTFDNGKEFVMHEVIATVLRCNTFFAKPYHSWERGQNENANGLLRQYFPKSMQLDSVKKEEVYKAVNDLNDRPRKGLDYLTPYEEFQRLTGINVKKILGYAVMT